jgi:hypothetical protein
MAFAVWTAMTTIGTLAIPDLATETKPTNLISLPSWYSKVLRPTVYASLNSKATTVAANRWRIKKG